MKSIEEKMMEAYAEMVQDGEIVVEGEELGMVLKERPNFSRDVYGREVLPAESLLLGLAEDKLPVLLNTYDPIPGSILVMGSPDSKYRSVLKVAAEHITLKRKGLMSFAVITTRPSDWNFVKGCPAHNATYKPWETASDDLVLALASWAHSDRGASKPVVLLIDDLFYFLENCSGDTRLNLNWLLKNGSKRRVWVVAGADDTRYGDGVTFKDWFKAFGTHLFSRIDNPTLIADVAEMYDIDFEYVLPQKLTSRKGAFMEDGEWCRFDILEPEIGYVNP